MKFLIGAIFLIFSISSNACPQFEKKYQCDKNRFEYKGFLFDQDVFDFKSLSINMLVTDGRFESHPLYVYADNRIISTPEDGVVSAFCEDDTLHVDFLTSNAVLSFKYISKRQIKFTQEAFHQTMSVYCRAVE